MSLFGKKKEETKSCCGGNCSSETKVQPDKNQPNGAAAKILGSGCPKCNQLESNTVAALKKMGLDTTVDHVKDFSEIASYGVISTPALVYNGKVISYGKVLKTEEVVSLLQKEM